MAWAVRDQRQPFAVMEQLLVPGNAPKRERGSILRRIGVGIELQHQRIFADHLAPIADQRFHYGVFEGSEFYWLAID